MAASPDSARVDAHYGFYRGSVTNVADPQKRGRIKARIAGLIVPETAWADPVGFLGSGRRAPDLGAGAFWVPDPGSTVVIGFFQGDLDAPFYLCGPWPKASTHPHENLDIASEDTDQVFVLASKNWQIIVDDRDGKESLTLQSRTHDDGIQIKELTNGDVIVNLRASTVLSLQSHGAVQISGTSVNLYGGTVTVNGKRIG